VTTTAPLRDHTRALSQQGVDAVLWQHTSAEAMRLYEQCYELARIKLDNNLQARDPNDPRQPAVIVDVDETVLDNSPYEVEAIADGRTYTKAFWKDWVRKEDAEALPGSVEFLRYAADRGCVVFYITNRAADEKGFTVENLRRLGFPHIDDLHVMAKDSTSDKTARRAKVASGHPVVLLVGDQLTDFDERLKDRSSDHGKGTVIALRDTLSRYFVLLPNPMYGTWRDAITGVGDPDSLKLERVQGFFREYRSN
jgi:5'-nucleotidase (lipoprotein e(P4) family)